MNILLLSVGTRNKVVQYFKETIKDKGRVIATDMSELSPAIYEADAYYIVPPITDPSYISSILDICKKEKIQGILSLIDPELELISKNKDVFHQTGTTVIGSDCEKCSISMDKYRMYQWLSTHGYHAAKSWKDIDVFLKEKEEGVVDYPVFVKPIEGSASINISMVSSDDELKVLFSKYNNLLIQEYLKGVELGVDVYIDIISGEVISIFIKEKIKMRAGETDKAVGIKDDNLFELIKAFVEDFGYSGQIDIDVFDVDGTYYISEVNPRFGGGYPLAYESGCNHMDYIVNNLEGRANKPQIGEYEAGRYMMKYNELKTIKL